MGEVGTAVAPFWGAAPEPPPQIRQTWRFHTQVPTFVQVEHRYDDDAGGDLRFHTDIFDGGYIGMLAVLHGCVRGEFYAPPANPDWNYRRYAGTNAPFGAPYSTGGTSFAWDYMMASATSGGGSQDYEFFTVYRPITGLESLPSDGDGSYIPLTLSPGFVAWMSIVVVDPGFAWNQKPESAESPVGYDFWYSRDFETEWSSPDPPLHAPYIFDDPQVGHVDNSTDDGAFWVAKTSCNTDAPISGVPSGYTLLGDDTSAVGDPDDRPRWRVAYREADSVPNNPSTFTSDGTCLSQTGTIRAYRVVEVLD